MSTISTSRPSRRCLGEPLGCRHHRVAGLGEDRHVDLPAERAQLLDGSGPLEVGTDEERLAALGLEPASQLGGVGRLAGALEAGNKDHRRWPPGEGDLQRLAAEDAGQLGVDDLDDLLAGIERLRLGGPDRLGADPGDDVAGDGDVDVGLQQGGADLAHDVVDVGLRQAALAAQALDDALEADGEVVEHAFSKLPARPPWPFSSTLHVCGQNLTAYVNS